MNNLFLGINVEYDNWKTCQVLCTYVLITLKDLYTCARVTQFCVIVKEDKNISGITRVHVYVLNFYFEQSNCTLTC